MTTIITNDKFDDILINKINEQKLEERPVTDAIRLVITACVDSTRCIVHLSGFKDSETFAIAGSLEPLAITRLIEKIREHYFLQETEFNDKVVAFRFTNFIGNISLSFNIRPEDLNINNEFLNIRLLLKQYYKNEAGNIYNASLDGINVDVNNMSKAELLSLFSELGEDELRNLINFLPSERLKMIYMVAFDRNNSQGRK